MTNLPYARTTTGLRHVVWDLLLTSAMVSPVLVSGVALADTQCGDMTCGKGFTCESYAAPCAAAVSKDGTTATSACENTMMYQCVLASCTTDSDCATDMVCHSEEVTGCTDVATPVCPPDVDSCTTTLAIPEPSCTTTTKSMCTPRYVLPCNVASDCGEGFTCEPDVRTVCSGSSGSAEAGGATGIATGGVGVSSGAATSGTNIAEPAPSTLVPMPPGAGGSASAGGPVPMPPGTGGSASVVDPGVSSGAATSKISPSTDPMTNPSIGAGGRGGAAGVAAPSEPTTGIPAMPVAPPPEEICTTVVTNVNYCKVKTITCNSDADCPSNFACQQAAVRGSCAVSSDGTTSCTTEPPMPRTCAPKYYWRQGGYDSPTLGGIASTDAGRDGKSESGTNNGSEPATQAPTPTAPSSSAGPTPAPAPSSPAPAPAASSVTTPVPTGTPAADPTTGNAPVTSASSTTAAGASEPAGAATAEPSDSDGGCSMSNTKSNGRGLASMLLIALGFAAMRSRRRAQI